MTAAINRFRQLIIIFLRALGELCGYSISVAVPSRRAFADF
jgi:hypothetical protein